VAVRDAAFGLCESQADVAAAHRFDPIVSNEPASTRLLLLAMSGAPKHWAQPRSSPKPGLVYAIARAIITYANAQLQLRPIVSVGLVRPTAE
jgi:hypothetical protein